MRDSVVCVDLDHTLIEYVTPFWTVVSQLLQVENPGPPKEHDVTVAYPGEFARLCMCLFKSDWYMNETAKPIPYTSSFLSWLKDRGNTVIVVTARMPEVRQGTHGMLFDHFENLIDEVRFVDIYKDKSHLVRELGCDLWIDDKYDDTKRVMDLGIPSVLVNRPWNKHNRHIPYVNNIVQVIENWRSILRGGKEYGERIKGQR